jgi:hypothetical protein
LAIVASIDEACERRQVREESEHQADMELAFKRSSLDSPSTVVSDLSKVDLATTAFEQLDVEAFQVALELIQDVYASQLASLEQTQEVVEFETAPLEQIQDVEASQAAPLELIQDVYASQLAPLECIQDAEASQVAPLELIQDVEASQAGPIEQTQEVVESQPAALERIQEAVTSQVALREQMKETLASPTPSITSHIMDEQVVHFNLLEITEVEQVVVEAPIISKVEPVNIRKVWYWGVYCRRLLRRSRCLRMMQRMLGRERELERASRSELNPV